MNDEILFAYKVAHRSANTQKEVLSPDLCLYEIQLLPLARELFNLAEFAGLSKHSFYNQSLFSIVNEGK